MQATNPAPKGKFKAFLPAAFKSPKTKMPRNPKKLSAPPIAAFKIGLQTQVFKIVCKHTYIIKYEKLNK